MEAQARVTSQRGEYCEGTDDYIYMTMQLLSINTLLILQRACLLSCDKLTGVTQSGDDRLEEQNSGCNLLGSSGGRKTMERTHT